VYRKSAVVLYVLGLVLALARGSPAIGASVLALAGTMGDLRVSRRSISKISPKPNVLGRTLRRLGGQITLLAFVLLDTGSLGFALVAPVWLPTWMIINLTALVLGTLSWSENGRMQRKIATAMQRQAEQVRAAEREWEALRQLQAQQAQERAQQAERLCQAEQQLRETEEWRRQEEEEREALRQLQAEQAERLRLAEQQLIESEERLRQEEKKCEALRQQQAERLRQAEERREAEQRQRKEERKAQRRRQGEGRQEAQFQADWWSILGVAPSASKDDIVRNFRRRIKQCHPDRVAGLAPEFLQLAEEHTKVLNEAYENALRCRRGRTLR
jgi:DnaJ-domain-containing protein 1